MSVEPPSTGVEQCQVLVVGGGIAGAVAAIVARQHGLDVLLIDRSFFGTGGCSAVASGMFSYFKEGDDLDHWLSNHGGTMVNQTLLADALRLQGDLVHEMETWGVRWVKEADGEIARMGGPGIPFPHSAMMAGGGPKFMGAIRAHALRIGVRVRNRTLVTDLLTEDGIEPATRVVGALAVNTRSGELTRIEANATVLATGPMHFPYPRPASPFTGMPIDLSGDGIAIAMRAGAEVGKMELGGDGLVQALFHCAQGFEMLLGMGGSFANAEGEDFLARYSETRGLGTGARRSVLGSAGISEIIAGRGPILRDNRGLDSDQVRLLDLVVPIIMETFRSAGISVERDLVPYLKAMVGSTAVSGAGVRITPRGESSVPGLFAAGNTSDGAYVIMGQNLSTCAVMGKWVGDALPEAVAAAPTPRVSDEQVQQLASALLAPMGRATEGPTYQEVHHEIESLLLDTGHVLDDRSLERAIERIKSIRHERLPLLSADDWHEFAKLPGLTNFCEVLETSYVVMRHRTESRGNILRSDYPATDNDNWLTMTVARRFGDEVRLHDVPRPDDEHHRPTPPEIVPHPFFRSTPEAVASD
jgi:succinate dehydrogenase / fumarate reductase flavoprotein subunit